METFIQEKKIEMLQLIERLVNIDSGSYVKKGVDQVGSILKEKYEELGFLVKVIEEKEFGNNMVIQHKNAEDPKIILVAHMDTVFPEGTVFRTSFLYRGQPSIWPRCR